MPGRSRPAWPACPEMGTASGNGTATVRAPGRHRWLVAPLAERASHLAVLCAQLVRHALQDSDDLIEAGLRARLLLNDRAVLTKPLRFAMQPADHISPKARFHQNKSINGVGHLSTLPGRGFQSINPR